MISIFLASILCAGAPLAAENIQPDSTVEAVSKPAFNSFEMGSLVVEKTRAGYEEGKYAEFLSEMDKDYNKAKVDNALEGLIELRKETGKVNIHPEFVRSQNSIQNLKNENLLKVVGSDESSFAQKVRSAASSLPADSQLLRSLHYKAPGSTDVNKDENAVIDIDLEYSYKSIHLDSLAASGNSIPDRKEKQMALEMERMDRLVKAAQSFEDKDLKQAIKEAASLLDQRLAKNYDMRDLLALAAGRVKPVSPLEEKAASIVGRAQDQIAELHRHLLNNLDSVEPIAEAVQK
jgi:hypothetical protein